MVSQVVNKTGSVQGFAFDLRACCGALLQGRLVCHPLTGSSQYTKESRGGSNKVKTTLKPIFRAYIISDYQGNEILLGAINTLVIWTQNKICTRLHRTDLETRI